MKAALIALVVTAAAPAHLTVVIFGVPAALPVAWFILTSEVLAAAGMAWLAVRAVRGFRSSPYLRPAFLAGGSP